MKTANTFRPFETVLSGITVIAVLSLMTIILPAPGSVKAA
jgi:hypothetical protein